MCSSDLQTELLLQKKDNNGVYIGKDNYFLQTFEAPDRELVARNANYINQFAGSFNVYMMLAPTATKVHEDKLPAFATPYDEEVFRGAFEEMLTESVHNVPLYEALKAHGEEAIYFKTDHHWTTLGAYYAYEAFCESYGIEALPLDAFEVVAESDAFYGSLFSKGNFTFAKPDTITLYTPVSPNPLEVTYVNENHTTNSLYDLSFMEEKDKYSAFLGGNHPIIEIKTSVANGQKLALIKDSYANAMLPFLVQHFEEVYVIDLRFLNMPIADYLRDKGVSDVAMVYNIPNFATVNRLSLLGK